MKLRLQLTTSHSPQCALDRIRGESYARPRCEAACMAMSAISAFGHCSILILLLTSSTCGCDNGILPPMHIEADVCCGQGRLCPESKAWLSNILLRFLCPRFLTCCRWLSALGNVGVINALASYPYQCSFIATCSQSSLRIGPVRKQVNRVAQGVGLMLCLH